MNIAEFLQEMAERFPDKIAVVRQQKGLFSFLRSKNATRELLTFQELESRSARYANGLRRQGIVARDRVLCFISPGIDFPCVVFALFKMGAVPVFIDPGMGIESMGKCIEDSGSKIMVGVKKAILFKKLKPKYFKQIVKTLVIGKPLFGYSSLDEISKQESLRFECLDCEDQEEGAILYTSGSTGSPKGVIYTQQIFREQILMLKRMFELNPLDVDMPGFPLFGLFTVSMGMTSVVPEMDPAKPAQCNPKKIVRDLRGQKVSFAAGSPAIWKRVGEYCVKKKITLPHLRAVAMFGAPVPLSIHRLWAKVLTNGTTYSPYGATECLPVSLLSGREILQETAVSTLKGQGVCVGFPAPGVEIQIRGRKSGNEIPKANDKSCGQHEIGEIYVKSPAMTKGYINHTEATAKARLLDQSGEIWHRMGDVGQIDHWGRLWFLGRRDHVLQTTDALFYPQAYEPIAEEHKLVERAALIKVNDQVLLAVIRRDRQTDSTNMQSFFDEILRMLPTHLAKPSGVVLFDSFPVDPRHNIKIDRPRLGELAAEKNLVTYSSIGELESSS